MTMLSPERNNTAASVEKIKYKAKFGFTGYGLKKSGSRDGYQS